MYIQSVLNKCLAKSCRGGHVWWRCVGVGGDNVPLVRHRCRDMPLSVRFRGACLDKALRDLSQSVALTITGRCDMRFWRLEGMFAQMAWFCEAGQSFLLVNSNDAYE